MDVRLDSLFEYEKIITDPDSVFQIVEKNGKVVLLKNNKPLYIILKYSNSLLDDKTIGIERENYTLHEAMKIVLAEVPNKTMHASKLADEIYNRRLYVKKDGGKAQYTQIRARCGHYTSLFEVLPGNYIRLKEE